MGLQARREASLINLTRAANAHKVMKAMYAKYVGDETVTDGINLYNVSDG